MHGEAMVKIKLTFVFILFFVGIIYAKDEIGSIFFGSCFLTNSEKDTSCFVSHEIHPVGVTVGFTLPVNLVKNLEMDYKVALSYYHVETKQRQYDPYQFLIKGITDYKNFSSGSNTILIGKEFQGPSNTILAPFFGAGICFETMWTDKIQGDISSQFIVELSFIIKKQVKHTFLGLAGNYVHGFYGISDQFNADNQISISMVILK